MHCTVAATIVPYPRSSIPGGGLGSARMKVLSMKRPPMSSSAISQLDRLPPIGVLGPASLDPLREVRHPSIRARRGRRSGHRRRGRCEGWGRHLFNGSRQRSRNLSRSPTRTPLRKDRLAAIPSFGSASARQRRLVGRDLHSLRLVVGLVTPHRVQDPGQPTCQRDGGDTTAAARGDARRPRA